MLRGSGQAHRKRFLEMLAEHPAGADESAVRAFVEREGLTEFGGVFFHAMIKRLCDEEVVEFVSGPPPCIKLTGRKTTIKRGIVLWLAEREDSFNSIVAHLACTRQHVARALDELETEGVVERTSNNVGHDANAFANKMEGAQGRRATSVWHGDRKFALTATGVARVPAFRALHAKTARRSTPSVTV